MNASSPSVLARELSEAERMLRQAGVQTIEVRVTGPPRAPRPSGPWRVVRQRRKGRDVQLVVAASLPPPGAEEIAHHGNPQARTNDAGIRDHE